MTESVDDVLAHFGVPGMKWGVRRSAAALASASKSKAEPSEDYKKAAEAKAKPAYALSNSEMQSLITRMDLEQRYVQAVTKASAKPTTRGDKAKKFVTDLLVDIGKQEITRVAKGKASLQVEGALKKQGQTELATRISPKKKK